MADQPELQTETGEATQTETTEQATEQTTEAQTPNTETTQTQEAAEDWRDKELKRKHAKLKERERELEQTRKERDDALVLAQARVDGKETPTETRPAQSQDEIQKAARVLRDQERYQEQLASTNTSGETTYKDQWGKALDKLATFGTIDPADMNAILNTDNPAKVLFEFGSNPAEYQRIMDLPPAKRLTEIVKISMKEVPKPKPNISNAPAPTESVGNRANPTVDLTSDKVSDEDWYAIRKKQKEERFKEQRALGRR